MFDLISSMICCASFSFSTHCDSCIFEYFLCLQSITSTRVLQDHSRLLWLAAVRALSLAVATPSVCPFFVQLLLLTNALYFNYVSFFDQISNSSFQLGNVFVLITYGNFCYLSCSLQNWSRLFALKLLRSASLATHSEWGSRRDAAASHVLILREKIQLPHAAKQRCKLTRG